MDAIMKTQVRAALQAMGYHERKPGHWLKPIGYQIFTYHEDRNEWTNWFKSGTGEIAIWHHKAFGESGPMLDQLKSFECWTRTDMFVDGSSAFELEASGFDL